MLQRIGNYELLDVLGRGGQGTVYRARHTDGHEAAVKVVAGAPSDAFIARFQREQAMASEIDSPYAVKIYEYGEEFGSYYIAMELVAGSLSGLLKDTPVLSTDRALHIADQIAAALEAAVAAHPGFVHRDIKPAVWDQRFSSFKRPNDLMNQRNRGGLGRIQRRQGGSAPTSRALWAASVALR